MKDGQNNSEEPMTNYFEIAVKYIAENAGPECAIMKEGILDVEDFYCFSYNSKKYLEGGYYGDMLIGPGSIIISKKDGRIFEYGSGYSSENAIADLRKRLHLEIEIKKEKPHFILNTHYDLEITRVKRKMALIELLVEYQTTYIIPEAVGNAIYRVAKSYTSSQLEGRLKMLPATFHGIDWRENVNLFSALLKSNSCEFNLIEHIDYRLEKYTPDATAKDLEPIW